jgi:hypothetical protein
MYSNFLVVGLLSDLFVFEKKILGRQSFLRYRLRKVP